MRCDDVPFCSTSACVASFFFFFCDCANSSLSLSISLDFSCTSNLMVPPDSGRFAFKAFDGLEPMGFLCEMGSAGEVTNHAAHTAYDHRSPAAELGAVNLAL